MKKHKSIDAVTSQLGVPLIYFSVQNSDIDYRGITTDNELHYRGNPSTSYSIPTVLPQDSRENLWYYRGITAIPITVQLSSESLISALSVPSHSLVITTPARDNVTSA